MVLEVLVFMLSMNCSTDFNHDFWTGFDNGMANEWNINSTTSCYQMNDPPSDLDAYRDLANRIVREEQNHTITTTSVSESQPVDFATYIDRLLGQGTTAAAISQQQENIPQQPVLFLTKYSDSIFERWDANGISYPTENIGFVRNNFQYSTSTLSHEMLHLVLHEEGYAQNCYVDKVHENQFTFTLKKMGDSEYPILKKFDC